MLPCQCLLTSRYHADIYKAAIAEKVEVANAQLKQLNKKMQLSLAHLYYVTLAFLGLWFAFLIVSVALKEHEAAGPGYICVAFVMLFIWLMDMVDTKLRKLKLLQSSIEVRRARPFRSPALSPARVVPAHSSPPHYPLHETCPRSTPLPPLTCSPQLPTN
jgi:hypothetical protein